MFGIDLIIKLIFKFWPYVLGAVVIGLAWWHYHSLVSERDSLKTQVVQLKEQKAVCEANSKDLQDKLGKVNAAIDAVSRATDKQTAELQKLKTDVAARTTDIRKGVDAIIKGQKPQTCEDSIKYLIDAVKEYK